MRARDVIYAVVVAGMLSTTIWSACAFVELGSAASKAVTVSKPDSHHVGPAHRLKNVLGVTLFSYVAGAVIFFCTAAISHANEQQERFDDDKRETKKPAT